MALSLLLLGCFPADLSPMRDNSKEEIKPKIKRNKENANEENTIHTICKYLQTFETSCERKKLYYISFVNVYWASMKMLSDRFIISPFCHLFYCFVSFSLIASASWSSRYLCADMVIQFEEKTTTHTGEVTCFNVKRSFFPLLSSVNYHLHRIVEQDGADAWSSISRCTKTHYFKWSTQVSQLNTVQKRGKKKKK